MKPQRLGVVDGGLGPDQITFFIVLLDGISPEPVFDAGVVVIQSPKRFGIGAGRPQAEYFGNGVGQSDTRELIQKPFKETGTETGRLENDIGTDFHLGQVPVVFQVFGPGGVFSFVKFEKQVHPIIDSLLDQLTVNFPGRMVECIWVRNICEGIVLHLVRHTSLIQLMADVVTCDLGLWPLK